MPLLTTALPSRFSAARWAALIGAVGALLLLGHYDGDVREILSGWFAGSVPPTAPVAAGGATFTTRSLPAMLLYGVLYVGLSILILHIALADRRKSRWVLLTYAAVMGLVGALLVAGRVLGMAATLTPIARDLIGGGPVDTTGLLSPLPVLLLFAAFRLAPAEAPPAPASTESVASER